MAVFRSVPMRLVPPCASEEAYCSSPTSHKASVATGTMVHIENLQTLICAVKDVTERDPNSFNFKCLFFFFVCVPEE